MKVIGFDRENIIVMVLIIIHHDTNEFLRLVPLMKIYYSLVFYFGL